MPLVPPEAGTDAHLRATRQADADLKDMDRESLEYLSRLEEDGWGDREAEGLGGLEVDDQLELHWLLHGKVGRLRDFQYFVHVGRGATKQIINVHPVGHQPPGFHKFSR